jgi:hypothetical protein
MRRSLAALFGPLMASLSVAPITQAATSPAYEEAQAHAFDFLMGTWKVQNTFLAKRLQHSRQWLKFKATDIESPLRTGTGNLEYYLTNHWPGFVGMGLRLYDSTTNEWRIYWSDNRFSRGVLQPPVIGTFHNGRGVFEGPDHFGGVPIIVRYTWRSVDHDHARWSQAFSRDDGHTWEVNWIMAFTRTSENVNASRIPGPLRSTHR